MTRSASPSDDDQAPMDTNLALDIPSPNDKVAAKLKIKSYKNRVFSLLDIYVRNSKTPWLALECLTESSLAQQPDKVDGLVKIIITQMKGREARCKAATTHPNAIQAQSNVNNEEVPSVVSTLKKIVEVYRHHLSGRRKTNSKEIPQTFALALNSLHSICPNEVSEVLKTMLQTFLSKRKTNLKAEFFLFIVRKLKWTRHILADQCTAIDSSTLRPAQAKQLAKIQSRLNKFVHQLKHEPK